MKKTKISCMILAFLFLASLLSGCKNETASVTTPGVTNSTTTNPAGTVEPTPETVYSLLPIVDEAVYYSLWTGIPPYMAGLIEDPAVQMSFYKEVGARTNIFFEFDCVASEAESERFFIMMASDEYPDIINIDMAAYYTTGGDGAIEDGVSVDLTSLVYEYAPEYVKVIESNPDILYELKTDNGAMVSFALVYKEVGMESTSGMLIRQDWMDELGLESPSTYDEFYNVIKAINVAYGASILIDSAGGDTSLSAGHGVSVTFQMKMNSWAYPFYVVDGEVRFGFAEPGFYDYIEMVSTWYKEGLIHPEWYDEAKKLQWGNYSAVLDDSLSVVIGVPTSISSMLSLAEEGSSMKFSAVGGLQKEKTDEKLHVGAVSPAAVKSYGSSVTTSCKDPVPFVKLINYLCTDEGSMLYNFGVENEAYTLDENGNPQWTELVTNDPDIPFNMASEIYASGVSGVIGMRAGVYDYSKNFFGFGAEEQEILDVMLNIYDYAWNYPSAAAMNATEEAAFNGIMSDLNTYMQESLLPFVTGAKAISEIEDFVNHLYTMGIEDAIAIKQSAYNRYLEATR